MMSRRAHETPHRGASTSMNAFMRIALIVSFAFLSARAEWYQTPSYGVSFSDASLAQWPMANPSFAAAGDSGSQLHTGWAGFLRQRRSLIHVEARPRLGPRVAASLIFAGSSGPWDHSFEISADEDGGHVVERTLVRGGLYGAAMAFRILPGFMAGLGGFAFLGDSSETYRETGAQAGALLRWNGFDVAGSGGFLQARTGSMGGSSHATGTVSAAGRFWKSQMLLSVIGHFQENEISQWKSVGRLWAFQNAGMRVGYDPYGWNAGLLGRLFGGGRHGLVEYSISESLRHLLTLSLVFG